MTSIPRVNLIPLLNVPPLRSSADIRPIGFDPFQMDRLPPMTKPDNAPENIYATIVKDGRTIATFYKGGSMMTPNNVRLPRDLADGAGPGLAAARIAQMLQLHGGSVEYASDAQVKSQSAGAQTRFTTQLIS